MLTNHKVICDKGDLEKNKLLERNACVLRFPPPQKLTCFHLPGLSVPLLFHGLSADQEHSVSPCCGVHGLWWGRGATKGAGNEQSLCGCPPALSVLHTGSIPWLPETFLVLLGLGSGAAVSAVSPPAFPSC